MSWMKPIKRWLLKKKTIKSKIKTNKQKKRSRSFSWIISEVWVKFVILLNGRNNYYHMCKCVKCNQLITPRSIECKKFQKNFRFWLTLLRRLKAEKRCCHGNVFGDKFLRTWRSNVRIRPVPRKTFGWNESDRSHGQLVMSIRSAHYGKYILNKYLFFLR